MNNKLPNAPTTRILVADAIGISTSTLMRKLKQENIKLNSGLLYEADLEKIRQVFFAKAPK